MRWCDIEKFRRFPANLGALVANWVLGGGRGSRFSGASLRLQVPVIGIRESQIVHKGTMKIDLFIPLVD